MSRKKLSPEALALIYLRSHRGWLQRELAERLGLSDYRQISRHESGETPLSRETLDSYASCLGYPAEAVDALLFIASLIAPDASEPASPGALTSEERRRIDRAVLNAAWTAAANVRELETVRKRKEKAAAARRAAERLWARLKTATAQERRDLVAVWPEFQLWALAVRVCEASIRAAAHRPEKALELAKLALFIAERVEGEERWRRRLMGYASAHIGNAYRVGNKLADADAAFDRAWELWGTEAPPEPELLPEWRLLDLEASLRREERRFEQALDLFERALAASQGNQAATGRILLNKGFMLEQKGDIEAAIVALEKAAPYIEASGDSRLLFALRFETAKNLWHLQRIPEAEVLLPKVRELAEQQGDELNLIRVVWLEARIAAGQGRTAEAVAGFNLARRDFADHALPYDAALASLDLAVLWLEAGRTAQVRELAAEMQAIFRANGIHREALAALKIFCDAARQETATVELTRRVMAQIETAKRTASRSLQWTPNLR